MVQNTSDIIYSVNKYCQVEMFLKCTYVCYRDIKYLSYKLADCSSIAKFKSLLMLFQEGIVKVSLAILD